MNSAKADLTLIISDIARKKEIDMKKRKVLFIVFALMFAVLCCFSSCAQNAGGESKSERESSAMTSQSDLPETSSDSESTETPSESGSETPSDSSEESTGESTSETLDEAKVLVVYFSYSGNTERVARIIAEKSGGNLVEIVPEIPYTAADVNYNDSSSRSQTERRTDARPEISAATYSAIDLSEYSAVFIGYPIWNGIEPMIIRTFIEHYDELKGATVYTFSTSASSGGSAAFNSIKSRCPAANVKENLHFTSSSVSRAESIVESKLAEWGL